jgi:hypothetical protein
VCPRIAGQTRHGFHEIGDVVVELADIIDVAAATGPVMATHAERIDRCAARIQRLRHRMHADGISRRAVDKHDGLARRRCGIGAERELRAVACRKELSGRCFREIDMIV